MKKIPVFLIVFAILVNYVVPITKVFADEGYTLSFSTTAGHTMEIENGHLKIDGQYVE